MSSLMLTRILNRSLSYIKFKISIILLILRKRQYFLIITYDTPKKANFYIAKLSKPFFFLFLSFFHKHLCIHECHYENMEGRGDTEDPCNNYYSKHDLIRLIIIIKYLGKNQNSCVRKYVRKKEIIACYRGHF